MEYSCDEGIKGEAATYLETLHNQIAIPQRVPRQLVHNFPCRTGRKPGNLAIMTDNHHLLILPVFMPLPRRCPLYALDRNPLRRDGPSLSYDVVGNDPLLHAVQLGPHNRTSMLLDNLKVKQLCIEILKLIRNLGEKELLIAVGIESSGMWRLVVH